MTPLQKKFDFVPHSQDNAATSPTTLNSLQSSKMTKSWMQQNQPTAGLHY
jgi:hypothetical protein